MVFICHLIVICSIVGFQSHFINNSNEHNNLFLLNVNLTDHMNDTLKLMVFTENVAIFILFIGNCMIEFFVIMHINIIDYCVYNCI